MRKLKEIGITMKGTIKTPNGSFFGNEVSGVWDVESEREDKELFMEASTELANILNDSLGNMLGTINVKGNGGTKK